MKRKEFYQLLEPLSERLYRFAYGLVPDDLQAEQLVIDAVNAYLLRASKSIDARHVNLLDKKDVILQRRSLLKDILKNILDIGIRRAGHLTELVKADSQDNYSIFYSLDPKVRFVIALRYDGQFSVEEMMEITSMPKYEVIEKLHNGRFLILDKSKREVQP
jgi:DNA-directed RNA polymerase specialized sigma24 family protein